MRVYSWLEDDDDVPISFKVKNGTRPKQQQQQKEQQLTKAEPMDSSSSSKGTFGTL